MIPNWFSHDWMNQIGSGTFDPFVKDRRKAELRLGLGPIGRLMGNMLWQNLLFSRQFLPSYQQAMQRAIAAAGSDFTQSQIEAFRRNQMARYGEMAQQMAARLRGQGGGDIESALMLNAQNQAMGATSQLASQLYSPESFIQRNMASAQLIQQLMGGDALLRPFMDITQLAYGTKPQKKRSGLGGIFGTLLGAAAPNLPWGRWFGTDGGNQ